jgi:hypothetical protein
VKPDQTYAELKKSYQDFFATKSAPSKWKAIAKEIHAQAGMAVVISIWEQSQKDESGHDELVAPPAQRRHLQAHEGRLEDRPDDQLLGAELAPARSELVAMRSMAELWLANQRMRKYRSPDRDHELPVRERSTGRTLCTGCSCS